MANLLIATNNPGKIREFTDILKPLGYTIVTLKELGITDAPPEDGETFAENSLLKANFYWQKSGNIDTLASDGGLEIEAFGNTPGVHTHRIDGKDRTDEELRRIILEKIISIPPEQRTARITTTLTLRVSKDLNFQAESSIEGVIKKSTLPFEPGYPARSIFWIPILKKFLSEITNEEHRAISHSRKAIEKLLPYLEQYVL